MQIGNVFCTMELSLDTTSHKITSLGKCHRGAPSWVSNVDNKSRCQKQNSLRPNWPNQHKNFSNIGKKLVLSRACTWCDIYIYIFYDEQLEHFHLYVASQKTSKTPRVFQPKQLYQPRPAMYRRHWPSHDKISTSTFWRILSSWFHWLLYTIGSMGLV